MRHRYGDGSFRPRRPSGRSDGGQFTSKHRPDQSDTRRLSLADPEDRLCSEPRCFLQAPSGWCPHHDPSPSSVVIKTKREGEAKAKRTTLVLQDGKWTPKKASSVFHLEDFLTKFNQTADELLGYTALVTADMLNTGDAPPYPDYLKWIAAAVRDTGHSLGLRGAWRAHTLREYPDDMTLMFGMAVVKTLYHLRKREEHLPKDQIKPFNPDAAVSGPTIVSGEAKGNWYYGEDGKILHRYVQMRLRPDGPTFFEEGASFDGRDGEDETQERRSRFWLAAYLLGEEQLDPALKEDAERCFHGYPERPTNTLMSHIEYSLNNQLPEHERCQRILEMLAAADPAQSVPARTFRDWMSRKHNHDHQAMGLELARLREAYTKRQQQALPTI